jgi:hypothetical protein
VALLGILAVLLQAVLFGWHHHALALGTPGGQPVATAASAAAPFSPAASKIPARSARRCTTSAARP